MSGPQHPMSKVDLDQILQMMRDDFAERQAWRDRFLADFEANIERTLRQELARALHPSVQRPAPAPLPANDTEHQPDSPPPPNHAA